MTGWCGQARRSGVEPWSRVVSTVGRSEKCHLDPLEPADEAMCGVLPGDWRVLASAVMGARVTRDSTKTGKRAKLATWKHSARIHRRCGCRHLGVRRVVACRSTPNPDRGDLMLPETAFSARESTALTSFAVERLRDAGVRLAVADTGGDPGHAPARRVYEKAGFVGLPLVRYYARPDANAGDKPALGGGASGPAPLNGP